MSSPRALVVIPTLGQRLDTLAESLESIRNQSISTDIVIVSPDLVDVRALASASDVTWRDDPGSQAAAINAGAAVGKSHDFIAWLNDDDLLEPDSLTRTSEALDHDPSAVLAFGACRYINESGEELWISRAGSWAPRILKWGPDLIPQPGMLIRRTAWEQVGGVDESLRFALDLDLLLRLQRHGKFVNVGAVVSSFRWHAESLTVADRTRSLQESEVVKRRALGPTARSFSWMWERPVRLATRIAAAEVSRRARRKTRVIGS